MKRKRFVAVLRDGDFVHDELCTASTYEEVCEKLTALVEDSQRLKTSLDDESLGLSILVVDTRYTKFDPMGNLCRW